MSHKVVLKADNLHKHYPVSQGLGKPKAYVKALNGISFELEAGKTLAVVVSQAVVNRLSPAS